MEEASGGEPYQTVVRGAVAARVVHNGHGQQLEHQVRGARQHRLVRREPAERTEVTSAHWRPRLVL